jgi:hypothetical protein
MQSITQHKLHRSGQIAYFGLHMLADDMEDIQLSLRIVNLMLVDNLCHKVTS